MMRLRTFATVIVMLVSTATFASAAQRWGMTEGTPELMSAGPIVFGPDGVLFVGDTKAATLFAIGTNDIRGDASVAKLNITDMEGKFAATLGVDAKAVTINDMAVNPLSGNAYFSVSAAGKPAIVRVSTDGKIGRFALDNVPFSKLAIPDAPEDKVQKRGSREFNLRDDSITDLLYRDATLMVSGASNAESTAAIREYAFPFVKTDLGTSVVIYHASHGRVEENAVPRVVVPFTVGGEPSLLAGFVCTPLVQFPISGFEPGKQVRGKTLAELGNHNKPLDMIVYEKDGQSWLLIANSARGVMKVSTKDIEKQQGLKDKVAGAAGLPYDTITDLQGVEQLDRLNETSVLIAVKTDAGTHDLRTIDLP
ncbi:MAG: hypothetical protein GC159_04510 [Phycisphaera sp.]|nr:hypothetical protein [Phycisphaera sp.]